jgi:uncharacterized protein (TIGR02466 family)
MPTETLFVTKLYRAELMEADGLEAPRGPPMRPAAPSRRRHGRPALVGAQRLSRLHLLRVPGRSPWRVPAFADLVKRLDRHVAAFAAEVDFDLKRRLKLDSIWINVLAPGGVHTGHIHPHSAVSGTYYVAVPAGAGAIRFEDPRLPLMMAAPPRKAKARPENRLFATAAPQAGRCCSGKAGSATRCREWGGRRADQRQLQLRPAVSAAALAVGKPEQRPAPAVARGDKGMPS